MLTTPEKVPAFAARLKCLSEPDGKPPTNESWIDAVCTALEGSGLSASQMAKVAVAAVPVCKSMSRIYMALGVVGYDQAGFESMYFVAQYLPSEDSALCDLTSEERAALTPEKRAAIVAEEVEDWLETVKIYFPRS